MNMSGMKCQLYGYIAVDTSAEMADVGVTKYIGSGRAHDTQHKYHKIKATYLLNLS